MEQEKVTKLAVELMTKYELYGWTLAYDTCKARFGCCNYKEKQICLSEKLCSLNDEKAIRDVILHEIAHALVGHRYGHNRVWKRKALEIGCDGRRLYKVDEVELPFPKYVAICASCQKEYVMFKRRRSDSACSACCIKHNNGKYDPKFKLTYERMYNEEQVDEYRLIFRQTKTP